MFPLQSVPTERTASGAPSHAEKQRAAALEQIGLLQEQVEQVDAYLAAAVKTRNLEDAASLRANQADLRAEIERLSMTV